MKERPVGSPYVRVVFGFVRCFLRQFSFPTVFLLDISSFPHCPPPRHTSPPLLLLRLPRGRRCVHFWWSMSFSFSLGVFLVRLDAGGWRAERGASLNTVW